MLDISMCENYECKKRNQCYRHTAKPEKYQSYAEFSEICGNWNNYKYMIPNGEKMDDEINN